MQHRQGVVLFAAAVDVFVLLLLVVVLLLPRLLLGVARGWEVNKREVGAKVVLLVLGPVLGLE